MNKIVDHNKTYSFTLKYAPDQKVVYERLGADLNQKESELIVRDHFKKK